MFNGLTEAFKDDPRVVLVALKTDGGSVRDALGYLKDRMDTDRWLIGTDTNATYARQLTGRDRLYTYAWITPDGQIGESGKAGSSVSGSKPKIYWAARNDAKKRYVQPARTLIDFRASVSAPLQPAILRAEQALFATALREWRSLSNRADLREEVTRVREAIATAVQASIERHTGLLSDENNRDRYFSYLALTDIESRFGGSPIAQAARNSTGAHAAHRAYENLMCKATRTARAEFETHLVVDACHPGNGVIYYHRLAQSRSLENHDQPLYRQLTLRNWIRATEKPRTHNRLVAGARTRLFAPYLRCDTFRLTSVVKSLYFGNLASISSKTEMTLSAGNLSEPS